MVGENWKRNSGPFFSGLKTFPREVRGTADPSATVGMTKGTVALPFKFDAAGDEQQVPPLRYAPVGMTLLVWAR